MKKIIIAMLLFFPAVAFSQNVGIGTTTPLARLHVKDSSVIFSAPYADGSFLWNLPINGSGSRMMWLPAFGAFRAGTVSGNYWNQDSIGIYSFASGIDTRALGLASTAMGQESIALYPWSTAIGSKDTASDFETVAIGTNNKASGFAATALGARTVASGIYATSMGVATKASGDNSTAIGSTTTASGNTAMSSGYKSVASGFHSVAIGDSVRASDSASTAFGYHSFAAGKRSTAFGHQTLSSGDFSTAFGYSSIAGGDYSIAMVNGFSSGANSVAIGTSAFAYGSHSIAFGGLNPIAPGDFSMALGNQSRSTGGTSVALGELTVSRANRSIALGVNNDSIAGSNPNAWISTDPLLYVGNGIGAVRSNAMVIYKNGNTDHNGYTRLGESSNGAPRIKTKKITGYNTPSSANPNSFTFVPHGLDASKILSFNVMVNISGNYEILPHSPDTGLVYTANTDPSGGGAGPSIAVGVKSLAQSSSVMGRPIKIFITYEE